MKCTIAISFFSSAEKAKELIIMKFVMMEKKQKYLLN